MAEKVARANAKRAVTRQVNVIRQCIATDKLENIDNDVEKLKSLFISFEQAVSSYQLTLESDEDIDNGETYFDEVQEKFIKVLEQVKSLRMGSENKLPDSGVSSNGANASGSNVDLATLLGAMNLPKVELEVFSGDPARYHRFIKSFELNVQDTGIDDTYKLTRLLQYTTGAANEAINGCILIGGPAGYSQAKSILKERFGNPHLVSETVVRNLQFGKPVRSHEDLRQLCDDAKNAKIVLTQLKIMNEVGPQSVLLDIVSRLQPYLQRRWQKRALEINDSKDAYPEFSDLCDFLSAASKHSSDPVYGFSYMKKDKAGIKSVSHVTNVSNSPSQSGSVSDGVHQVNHGKATYARQEPVCVLCPLRHRLWHCSKFRQMSPRERLALVERHRLCHNCLLGSHDTQSCGKKSVCLVENCGKKHTMYLHINSVNSANVDNSNLRSAVADGASTVTSGATSANHSTYMPVVQVKVNDTESVYALLDTGSSNSFCSQRLIDKLGVDGIYQKLNVSTLSDSISKNSKLVQLDVVSKDGSQMKLSGVYVVDNIPVKSVEIDVHMFDHLKGIEFQSLSNSDTVDLLIGQDHSEALIPLEVRKGKPGEPLAIRSVLGWCLNGSAHGQCVSTNVVSNFISINETKAVSDE